jgi:hypothetical protein
VPSVATALRKGNDVHVAFHDHDATRFAQRAPRLVQAVELPAFREERRFRRIQVLGLAAIQDPPAETDDHAAHVHDGEHDAITENVVAPAVFFGLDQAGGGERLAVVIREDRREVLPAVRGVADAEAPGDVPRQPPLLEISDSAGRVLQPRAVVLRRLEEHAVQIVALLAPALARLGAVFRDLQPDALRQLPDRVYEPQPGVLHQESDRGAVRLAAEAMVELLRLAHRERRGLLAVKRAAGNVIRARPLQLHVAVDHVHDIDPAEQFLDEGLRDHRPTRRDE